MSVIPIGHGRDLRAERSPLSPDPAYLARSLGEHLLADTEQLLAEASERERQLVDLNLLLIAELREVTANAERWAHDWAALQQLLAAEFAYEERHCCYCGNLFRGASKACGEHVYLLVHEYARTPDPFEQMLADLYPATVSDPAGAYE